MLSPEMVIFGSAGTLCASLTLAIAPLDRRTVRAELCLTAYLLSAWDRAWHITGIHQYLFID